MRSLFRIYKSYLRIHLALRFQYRFELLIWFLSSIVEPVVFLMVWRTVALQQGGSVGGYAVNDLVVYYILMILVNHATYSWFLLAFDYRIRLGGFSADLMKPFHPIHIDMADNFAFKLISLPALAAVVAVLVWTFSVSWQPRASSLAAFLPAFVLALLFRLCWEWVLAMLAFCTTRVEAISQVYFLAVLFFSGRLAPLDLFPQSVQNLAAILPFRWMLAFPVEILLGRVTSRELLIGLGIQLFWLIGGYACLQFSWRRGIRRYTAVGS